MSEWTTYQYDTVEGGYVIYKPGGEILNPWEITKLLNDGLKSGSIEWYRTIETKVARLVQDLTRNTNVLEELLDE